MRKAIAQRVQQAKRDVPHFRVNIDVDVSAALALRAQLNATRSDVKLSLNDILLKACACALRQNPALNARFDGEQLERHSQCHIATAVAIDGGVMMLVLREVERKGLAALSGEMRDLATRAKIGRLTGSELDGATFSVSNLGMFGISSFDAIINQPAVAILAVGTAEQRPVVRDGELTVGHCMSLSLASDHRVVDGADAARFLADLRGFLEAPGSMLA
jgi:pyruvate dehydrogenase E2 component (dihydrolipoamide acetyltransferase)